MNARLYDPALGRFLSPDPYVQAPDFTQNFNRYSYCLNNPLKYNDNNGELFKEIFGFMGLIVLPFDFTFNLIFSGQNIKTVWNNSWNNVASCWNGGKSIDQSIFGRPGGYQNSITGQPGQNNYGPLYSTTVGGLNEKYYKFDDLKAMVKFMWETSNKSDVDVEIAGYVLKDEEGNSYYYVIDWSNGYNTNYQSFNPYYVSNNPNDQRPKFDGKYIVAEMHTHPASYYQDKYAYDGNSYNDYRTSVNMGVPVYSIGPKSVSVITSKSIYKTQVEFDTLSKNTYGFSSKLEKIREVNPFYLDERKKWLENPIITTAW